MVADPHADSGAEARAYRLLERLRWGASGPDACPHCGSQAGAYYLRPADGLARATRTGARSARRVWRCAGCRRQFSVLTATLLERTRIPVSMWVITADALARGVPVGRTRASARVASALGSLSAGAATRDELLTAALRVDPVRAADLRRGFRGSRPRTGRRQAGPTADYGDTTG